MNKKHILFQHPRTCIITIDNENEAWPVYRSLDNLYKINVYKMVQTKIFVSIFACPAKLIFDKRHYFTTRNSLIIMSYMPEIGEFFAGFEENLITRIEE